MGQKQTGGMLKGDVRERIPEKLAGGQPWFFLYIYLDVLPKSTELYRLNKFNLFLREAGFKLR